MFTVLCTFPSCTVCILSHVQSAIYTFRHAINTHDHMSDVLLYMTMMHLGEQFTDSKNSNVLFTDNETQSTCV